MDPRLLRYYNQELAHLREMGSEFASQFPKIAARLGMDGIEVTDPYIERLLEGSAFLAARVQLKLEAEFPRFTKRLLEIVYPHYLAPTPSMLIAQFQPQLSETNLAEGFLVPRGSLIRSQLVKGDTTACEFSTAQDITLWPIQISSVQYFSYAPDLPLNRLKANSKIKGGIRIKLNTTAGLNFSQIQLDKLRLYFSGSDEIAYKLHELCHGACVGAVVAPTDHKWPWHTQLPSENIKPVGYADGEALLPVALRTFQGYRLLQEYFAFPQRFLFIDIDGLAASLSKHHAKEVEIILLFSRGEAMLESVVDLTNFSLFCTPAINLFPKRVDRIHLSDSTHDYHVVPDRTKPMDFEIFDISDVTGHGVGANTEKTFLPFYAAYHKQSTEHNAYYTLQREPRLLSTDQKRNGTRSSYIGSEVFLSLVDANEAPYSNELRQLSLSTLCTNRDLPLLMPTGIGKSDFVLDAAAPFEAIVCIKGPSRPHSPLLEDATAWKFISHLSLNYLSLFDKDIRAGASALREMLELYSANGDEATKKQIEGLQHIQVQRVTRRLPLPGPIVFGRGLEIKLLLDEIFFQGSSAFLFTSVMEQFFARYVSINSFTETVFNSTKRGEVMRWRARLGERPVL